MIKSVENAEHYHWGDHCDGWHLLKLPDLSVIQERMPPGTSEQLHYHEHARQVFFILAGTAIFIIGEEEITVQANQSLHIEPHTKHRILNNDELDLHFLVISAPRAHGDRVNL